ncbi:hypothetical protein [Leptospira noguchii]|uniref:Uncharacterized protein n=1 Tax=Leptospira noguchii serovar Panama str. CZ214 TaxID=1001595 RepID=T0F9T8_9LEPT|nr:hypothetical protein [Leptospira noguchii]EQA69968.1 hypothetical protein LEP1GSC059_2002 [Leptospira noguchii serovar Panama str. CZ214]
MLTLSSLLLLYSKNLKNIGKLLFQKLIRSFSNTQTSFNDYAYARGYKQFKIIEKSTVEFPSKYLKFEDFENGIDFTDAFEAIDSILESCNSKEYQVVKKLYNSFLSVLLNEILTKIFAQDSDDFW